MLPKSLINVCSKKIQILEQLDGKVKKLGMTVSNVCAGPQDRRQVFVRLKFELNGPFDEFVQVDMKIFSAQKWNVPDNN